MNFDLRKGIVRILNSNGETAGTGFILPKGNLVITCAHVVEFAGYHPGDNIELIFHSTQEKRKAKVLSDFWHSSNAEDVAILRLSNIPSEGVEPLLIGNSSGIKGHQFETFGFPERKKKDGLWGVGKILGFTTDYGSPVLQIQSPEVTVGFSGAPAWNKNTRRVIGMVTSILGTDEYGKQTLTAFVTPTSTLKKILPELEYSDLCPYSGLEAFTEKNAEFFYGRQKTVARFIKKLDTEIPFLGTILGASGSGKSSLVQAGIIHQLKAREKKSSVDQWEIILARPKENPFEELAKQGLQITKRDLSNAVQTWVTNQPQQKRLLIIFDQFEEVLVSCSEVLRQEFFQQILKLSKRHFPLTIILVMRSDFYHLLTQQAQELIECLNEGFTFNVPELTEDDLKSIVLKPAEDIGLKFEEGLADNIVKDVIKLDRRNEIGENSIRNTILPLLEFTLKQLWEERQEGMLTNKTYQNIDEVTGSLAKWANQAYQKLEKKGLDLLVPHIFTNLVHLGKPSEGVPDSKRVRQLKELYEGNESQKDNIIKIVKILADKRLLVTDYNPQDNQNSKVEIIHDALLREWKKLKDWLQTNRSFLEWYQSIEEETNKWKETDKNISKRDESKLLRGRELSEAKEWLDKRQYKLKFKLEPNPDVQDFIRTSENKDNLRKFISSAVKIIFLLISAFGLWQFSLSSTNNIYTLIARSDRLFQRNKELEALIESVKAGRELQMKWWLRGTVRTQVETQLREVFSQIQEHNRLEYHDRGVTSISFSPNGKTLTSASLDGAIRSWSLVDKKILPELGIHKNVTNVSFNNDGTMLVSSSWDGKVMLWDLDSNTGKTIAKERGNIKSVSFSPNGKTIAFAIRGGSIKLWNIDSKELDTFETYQEGVRSISFSPNEKTIASAGKDGTIKLWNIDSKELEKTLGSPQSQFDTSPFQSISISPADNKTIVSGHNDGTIKLWNVDSQKSDTIASHKPRIISIDFSPQGKYIASTGVDNTIKLWSREGTLIKTLSGHKAEVFETSFNPEDNNMLASSSSDKSIKIWNLDKLPKKLLKHNKTTVFSVDFSTNNQYIASAARDGKIRIWDLEDRKTINNKKPLIILSHKDVFSINFSPDNQYIASASQDGTIKLWQLNKQELIESKTWNHSEQCSFDEECAVNNIIFSSSECQLLVSASDDGTVKIWNTNGEERQILEEANSNSPVYDVSLSSDCQYIASANEDGNIILWKREENLFKFFKNLSPKHKEEVWKVRFSPDNRHIASVSGDGTIKIWNSDAGNLVSTLDGHDRQEVLALSFSSDGQFLASGSKDGKIKIWELNKNKLLQTISGHERGVWSIDFSENGQFIASASEDGTVKLWINDSLKWQDLNLDKLLEQSCIWLQDYLKYNPNVQKERRFCS